MVYRAYRTPFAPARLASGPGRHPGRNRLGDTYPMTADDLAKARRAAENFEQSLLSDGE